MILYQRVLNGRVTHQWTDLDGDATYTYGFTPPDPQSVVVQSTAPADIAAAATAENSKKIKLQNAKTLLLAFDPATFKATDVPNLIQAMIVLHGVK